MASSTVADRKSTIGPLTQSTKDRPSDKKQRNQPTPLSSRPKERAHNNSCEPPHTILRSSIAPGPTARPRTPANLIFAPGGSPRSTKDKTGLENRIALTRDRHRTRIEFSAAPSLHELGGTPFAATVPGPYARTRRRPAEEEKPGAEFQVGGAVKSAGNVVGLTPFVQGYGVPDRNVRLVPLPRRIVLFQAIAQD